MGLVAKILGQKRTYLEFGVEQVKLVQTKASEVIYERSFEYITDNLNFYLQHLDVTPKWISLLIPTVNLFLRTLDFPLEAENRLTEIIQIQFLEQLPCPPEEVYSSYYIAQKTEERIKVVAFAVLKNYLDDLHDLCKQSGFKVKSIVPVPLVFYLLYSQTAAGTNNILYVDSCLNYFNYTFLSSQQIYLRSSQTKDIQETKNYLLEELEQQVVDVQETTTSGKEFWLKVKQAAEGIAGQDFIDLSTQIRQSEWQQIGWVASGIILLVLINFILQWNLKQAQLEDLKTKLNQVQPVVEKLHKFEEEVMVARDRTTQLKEEITWQNNYLPWLIELNNILGPQVKVEQLNFSETRLVLLAGTAPRAGAVMNKLEQSSYFKNLDFTGTIETLAGRERFKIEGDLSEKIE
ncbi:hypothetical protein [Halanaerobacter jeridensis]|uniref:Myosin heavy subunit n=1 Tax=Halanaerobacter jeridensis TaxID=706427 RepID=A0A938XWF9_9FIRM|nr:hypothetical protein [Halanaerobacter jeridensis]MBM7557516.1 myosin heavy subunit [Halanaerobacter jeridensis]